MTDAALREAIAKAICTDMTLDETDWLQFLATADAALAVVQPHIDALEAERDKALNLAIKARIQLPIDVKAAEVAAYERAAQVAFDRLAPSIDLDWHEMTEWGHERRIAAFQAWLAIRQLGASHED